MKRVAIVGGGMGAMAAAFELCHQDAPVDITVYQLGHRLGGKGASGRRADDHQRIEEHGLHAFSGIYENAFFVLRQAYQAIARDPLGCPIATWQDAFKPCRRIVLHEDLNGVFEPWVLNLPTNRELPGEPGAKWWLGANTYASVLRDLWKILHDETGEGTPDLAGDASPVGSWTNLSRWFSHLALSPNTLRLTVRSLGVVLKRLWPQVQNDFAQQQFNKHERRRTFIALNFLYGNLRGFLAANAFERGLDELDEHDYCEWLARYVYPDEINGKSLTANSPLARFVYDAQFSFVKGDITRPRFAAGAALRTLIRMAMSWKGAVIWKMQAGMGDIVFAPLYEYLKQRGVKFRFFHRLEAVELNQHNQVSELRFAVQATTKSGAEYEPLVNIKGVPSWPSEPLLDQLDTSGIEDGSAHAFESFNSKSVQTLKLQHAKDFDAVVLGTSIAALPHVAPALLANSQAWRDACQHVATVQTQAAQLWTQEPPDAERQAQGAIGICYNVGRLNTYASMHHLLERETWPNGVSQPNTVWYLCGVHDEVSLRLAATHDTHEFVEKFLPDLAGATRRVISEYTAPAPNPSDRFVQSLPGTTAYRLDPAQTYFGHLFVAGDWTRSGFNMGNAEAATMSGRRCARALLKHLQIPFNDDPIVGERFL